MVRLSFRLAAVLLLLFALVPAQGYAAPPVGPSPVSPEHGPAVTWKASPTPSLSANAAILMDWRTGRVLYARQADLRREPASTTKVLTALIAAERGDMDAVVKISRRAANTGGSRMHISTGEVYSLYDLLHGLLLRSGNDAAVAIAEHIAGSVEEFARLMNAKAAELGATNSHFMNPHGLPDPQHWSTARDLAIITRHALHNQIVARIVSLRESPITYEQLDRSVVLYNTNRLLSMLPGADGVKTGTTASAGRCLIASATRDEQKLVAVVLHAPNRWNDAAQLLEWGFKNFRLAFAGREGERLLSVPVRYGKERVVPLALTNDLPVLLPRQDAPEPVVTVRIDRRPVAPVRPGQPYGQVRVEVEGNLVAESALVAATPVATASIADRVYRTVEPILEWVLRKHIF